MFNNTEVTLIIIFSIVLTMIALYLEVSIIRDKEIASSPTNDLIWHYEWGLYVGEKKSNQTFEEWISGFEYRYTSEQLLAIKNGFNTGKYNVSAYGKR